MTRPASIFLGGGALFAAGLLAGFLLGRTCPAGPLDGGDGPAVATFGGHALRADALRAALATLPAAARTGVEPAKKVAEELARTRVLALAAIEKGYDRDPELVRQHAEQLAAAYLEKEIDAPERARQPTEDEARAFLEAHRADYARPERVRVALVSFVAPTPAERPAERARATVALREARARAGEYYAFGELARAKSEDPRAAARNGELGETTREELAAAAGAEVAAAAFAMKEPGVHDAVIESAAGFHVLKLLGHEAAYEPRIDELRDTLRSRLTAERRAERRRALLDRAWKDARVRIDEGAVRKVVAELRSGAR
jgi:parvulin-like peptidyl-prolyl isomerase